MTATGDETLRQRYLAAMGITPWLPTQTLPGAAVSPRWHWQTLDPAPESPARVAPARADTAPRAAGSPRHEPPSPKERVDVRSLIGAGELSRETAAPERPVRPEPAVTAAKLSQIARAPESTAIPRFRLWLNRYANCLVLNDLPLDAGQPVTPQHQHLLAAILNAAGLGGDLLSSHIVSWPMFAADSGHDQSADVARMMLRVEAGFDQLPPRLPLLLLGEQAGNHLLGEDAGYDGIVVRGPSLNEMLRIPARKADLWRALQPLRQV